MIVGDAQRQDGPAHDIPFPLRQLLLRPADAQDGGLGPDHYRREGCAPDAALIGDRKAGALEFFRLDFFVAGPLGRIDNFNCQVDDAFCP